MLDRRTLFVVLLASCLTGAAACGSESSSSGSTEGGTTTSPSTGGSGGTGTTSSGGSGGAGGTSSGGSGGTTATANGGSGGAGGATTSSTGTAGAGAGVDCGPSASGPAPALKLTEVASGLSLPVLALGAPADTSRLYIVEQGGRIQLLKDGVLQATPFLDISAVTFQPNGAGDERGLLGLAFHPDYAENGRFFVFYTADLPNSAEPNLVVEYQRSANPDVAAPTPVKQLLSIGTDAANHNGGMLAFGSDGKLYVAHGEGGTSSLGQDITVQFGKILRIDVDTHPTPVPGNLQGGDPHIWDYGLRNPYRFSFDRCSGDLYIGDVGGQYEEINVEPKGQGLHNYGWDLCTGTECPGGITLPVVSIDHGGGDCSVIGGYVYRGSAIAGLAGRYLYGDYCSNRIRSFVWNNGVLSDEEDLSANLESQSTLIATSSFGEDDSGNLYVVDLGGFVYRIDEE